MKKILALIAIVPLISACSVKEVRVSQAPLSIVPKPVSVLTGDDDAEIGDKLTIIATTVEEKKVALLLKDYLAQKNIKGIIGGSDESYFLKLSISKNDFLGVEGYKLTANENGILISANAPAGLFYGMQTFMQLIQPDGRTIPHVEITDYPRFAYRGLHLDVGRHMFPPDFIKKYIDLMARHKLNRFHWHLTEDQGWRIEIKKYPKLQEVAAYRDETVIGRASTRTRNEPHQFDGQRYGGFYTQEEIKDIVKYAADRYIEVIPEIELPGHAMAALAAYPDLGCTGGPYKTATTWGIFPDVYCAGKENTFTFLQDVFDEVLPLFPGKYIHVGGDEVFNNYFTTAWEKCPHCKKRMKEENLKDKHALQSDFIQRMEKYLNSKGRQIIGWDEILEGGLAPNATVMSWRGEEGGIAAARQNHDVIMTPEDWMYFDHAQDTVDEEPVLIRGYTPLEEVYSYEPVPEPLSAEQAKHILGVQANVWTEYMKTPQQVEYMAYPRACALSEVGWTQKDKRDYADFAHRLQIHFSRLQEWDVNYAKHLENEFTIAPATD